MDYWTRTRNRLSNIKRLNRKWAKKSKHTGLTVQQWRDIHSQGGIQRAVRERLDKSWRKAVRKFKTTRRNDKDERRDRR